MAKMEGNLNGTMERSIYSYFWFGYHQRMVGDHVWYDMIVISNN